MAVADLIVEDGTALADADAYISVAYADSYHENFGNTDWAGLDDDTKAIYIRRATDYIEQVYRSSWKGSRTSARQSLSWPRIGVEADRDNGARFGYAPYYSFTYEVLGTVIPDAVKKACAIMALKVDSADDNDLAPDLERKIMREVIGPIDTTYAEYSPEFKRYRAVSLLLAPFVQSSVSFTIRRA